MERVSLSVAVKLLCTVVLSLEVRVIVWKGTASSPVTNEVHELMYVLSDHWE
jgi:hypothetical protein